MLEILKAVILGIVEGITEFLPISSTGHLVLVDEFIKLNEPKKFIDMFNVVIQLGAIMAVVVLYFHKLNPWSPKKSRLERSQTWTLWKKVIIAVIPSVIIGLPLNDWMDAHLMNWLVVSIALIVYGVLFIVIENHNQNLRPRFDSLNTLPYKVAILIGCFQILSLIPGTSRSGATILGDFTLRGRRILLLLGDPDHVWGLPVEVVQVLRPRRDPGRQPRPHLGRWGDRFLRGSLRLNPFLVKLHQDQGLQGLWVVPDHPRGDRDCLLRPVSPLIR